MHSVINDAACMAMGVRVVRVLRSVRVRMVQMVRGWCSYAECECVALTAAAVAPPP